MAIPKKEVMRRVKIHFGRIDNLTQREKKQIILYCRHTINLIEKIKSDGFIITSAIPEVKFKKEFQRLYTF